MYTSQIYASRKPTTSQVQSKWTTKVDSRIIPDTSALAVMQWVAHVATVDDIYLRACKLTLNTPTTEISVCVSECVCVYEYYYYVHVYIYIHKCILSCFLKYYIPD